MLENVLERFTHHGWPADVLIGRSLFVYDGPDPEATRTACQAQRHAWSTTSRA